MISDSVESGDFGRQVRSAVFWRSGSQIIAQLVMWCSTFFVLRLLNPADYGLFAMTQIILCLTALMNGYSFTGALVQAGSIDETRVRQVFGMLILMNFSMAAAQFLAAPLAASYFRQPIVADMLRFQSLIHLTTPFIMMPQALLARTIDFRLQARVNIAAALLSAIAAPTAALAGMGVWTLIIAPLVLFGSRAVGLAVVGRWWIRPSFRFAGAGAILGFGGAMLLSDILWFIQTQADVFIAGRRLEPHTLGIYTTALFFSQLFLNKVMPALNEVAFPAYARIQGDRRAVSYSFAKAVRIVMLAGMPFSIGLALTAEPLVRTVLGDKWAEAAPVIHVIGLSMPFVILRTLYQPATNALGRPVMTAAISAVGAIVMPIAFLIGVEHGAVGMGLAWLVGAPLLAIAATAISLPVIGVSLADLVEALRPAALATMAMTACVLGVDHVLPPLPPLPHLLTLVAVGGGAYALALMLVARTVVEELVGLLRGRAVSQA